MGSWFVEESSVASAAGMTRVSDQDRSGEAIGFVFRKTICLSLQVKERQSSITG